MGKGDVSKLFTDFYLVQVVNRENLVPKENCDLLPTFMESSLKKQ